jgi:endonuclease-3
MQDSKKRALEILAILEKEHPEARSLLDYENPFQLLVATILAAQCTDDRVNQVTKVLFARYPDPASMAGASIEELEELVRPTGFYRNKARSVSRASKTLVDRFDSEVPRSIEEMTEIPGVGRKTANVVVGSCFDAPAIMVDTHFKRVVGRLGLSGEKDPEKIEHALRLLIPEEQQTRFSYVINFHGRYRCKSRKPDCPGCSITALCPYPQKTL